MPPVYVKAHVKRGKTDGADAEAMTRPTMRFVAVKTIAQQAVLMLHKTRDLLVRQRTMLINALRGHLGEFGIVAPQGSAGVQVALRSLILKCDRLPELAQAALRGLAKQLEALGAEIDYGQRHSRKRARSEYVPLRPSVRRLARSHPTSAQQRRQGAPGWDQQDG